VTLAVGHGGELPGRPRCTARGWGAVGLFATTLVLAVVTGSTGLAALAVAAAVPLVASSFLARSRAAAVAAGARLSVHQLPAMVPVGDAASVELVVRQHGARPTPGFAVDRPERRWRRVAGLAALRQAERRPPLPRLAPARRDLVEFPPLAPGASARVLRPTPTGRRGLFVLDLVTTWVHDPFGLVGVPVAVTGPAFAVVHPPQAEPTAVPAVGGLDPLAESELADERITPYGGGLGELSGLRPYVPGDRLHLLHWPALARYGELLVREFDPAAGTVVRVLLDDRPGVHRRREFDGALSLTYGLAVAAVASGLPCEVVTLSGERTVVAPTAAGLAALVPVLAAAQPRAARGRSGRATTLSPTVAGGPPGVTLVTTSDAARSLPEGLVRRSRLVVA